MHAKSKEKKMEFFKLNVRVLSTCKSAQYAE